MSARSSRAGAHRPLLVSLSKFHLTPLGTASFPRCAAPLAAGTASFPRCAAPRPLGPPPLHLGLPRICVIHFAPPSRPCISSLARLSRIPRDAVRLREWLVILDVPACTRGVDPCRRSLASPASVPYAFSRVRRGAHPAEKRLSPCIVHAAVRVGFFLRPRERVAASSRGRVQ